MKHVVIDQNVYRQEALLRPAIRDAQERSECIVVADIALAEMMKAEQWESTTKRSLKILAEDPGVVVVSKAIGPAMRAEADSGEPANIIDDALTSRFRELLDEVRDGDGAIMEHVRKEVDAARALAKEQHFEHAHNKESLARMVAGLKGALSERGLKTIRSNDENGIRAILANPDLLVVCADALANAGYERARADALTMVPSVSSHVFLAQVALAVRWIDGIENVNEQKATNDLADMDYVIVASFCRELLTQEHRMKTLRDRLGAMIAAREKSLASTAAT